MDDNTITEYGWIVIVILVILAALVFVPQLNNIIEDTTKEKIEEPVADSGETLTSYTQKDIEDSNGILVAIGKNKPLDVVARFTHDYQSVIITKNGEASSGVVGSFPESYRSKLSALSSVTFAEGIVTIGANAFADCTSLKGIDFPATLKKVESGAFSNCTALTSIVFSGTAEQWNKVTIGGTWKTSADKIIQYAD